MPSELKGNNYYSRVFKRVNYTIQNSTFLVIITNLQHRLRGSDDIYVRLYQDDSSLLYELYLPVKGRWYDASLMNLRASEK